MKPEKEAHVMNYALPGFWQQIREHRTISLVLANAVVLLAMLLGVFGLFGDRILDTFAATPCSSGDQSYIVRGGDTLSGIAARYKTTYQRLADYNKLANPNLIYVQQRICIPGAKPQSKAPTPFSYTLPKTRGSGNWFAFPQCTWWANQRYYQLHGVYVPWTTNSDAWQWVNRARDFGWRVSYSPIPGSIIVFQPNVQGASWLGHVGIVERVNSNGSVTVSNTNWGANPTSVTYTTAWPGNGVAFVY